MQAYNCLNIQFGQIYSLVFYCFMLLTKIIVVCDIVKQHAYIFNIKPTIYCLCIMIYIHTLFNNTT